MPDVDPAQRAAARTAFQTRIGYSFTDRSLLARALTHRSAAANHNERLEFLGDGVLNFVIAAALYEAQPQAPEGDLSRLRAALVREKTLAAISTELGLADLLVMGPGEQQTGSRRRASIGADAVEAVLGAIYCDAGFETTKRVILGLYATRLTELPSAASLKDAKTQLQEWLQARGLARPEYSVVSVSGADHAQTFIARCSLQEPERAVDGQGAGRRKAEQDAARQMLAVLTRTDS